MPQPTNTLQPVDSAGHRADELRAELAAAEEELRVAEADLAQEQAAVNAFRMHARLMLDDLADAIERLLTERQSLLTRLELHRQAIEDEADPLGPHFRQFDDAGLDSGADLDDLPLPTATPHDKAAEKRLYRELARRFHPDLANGAAELAYRTSVMTAVNSAYTNGDLQALYDLAGELEPDELRELATIESRELRQLRERILRCRRRRRKVSRRLQLLREDKTARLWRKAREMRDQGEDWWTAVRRDLEATRERLEMQVTVLRQELDKAEREKQDLSSSREEP
ncbi:MAG: hypothetical protein LC131_00320 [Anaerolineae bacterium]|nr:hypothetical protein [Anaerolineae bacterium]HNS40722.1 hypothetical protein [Promineifilum sp.]